MVLENLWLGKEESEAIATALQPKLTKTRANVEGLLQDVVTLEVALHEGADPVALANLLPKLWATFIRNSALDDVRPIGTTPLTSRATPKP